MDSKKEMTKNEQLLFDSVQEKNEEKVQSLISKKIDLNIQDLCTDIL